MRRQKKVTKTLVDDDTKSSKIKKTTIIHHRPALQLIINFSCDWQLTWNYVNWLKYTKIKFIWVSRLQLFLHGAYPPPDQTLTTVLFTFLGEKLSAVPPSSDHFAWDLPKELHDQSDVVCPPPHTSQREQARFSITACTHTSTQLAVRDWHTLLPWSTAWTHSQMDSSTRTPWSGEDFIRLISHIQSFPKIKSMAM